MHYRHGVYLTDPKDLRVIQNAYFSLLTPNKQLLLVTFCDNITGILGSFWTYGNTGGNTDIPRRVIVKEGKTMEDY